MTNVIIKRLCKYGSRNGRATRRGQGRHLQGRHCLRVLGQHRCYLLLAPNHHAAPLSLDRAAVHQTEPFSSHAKEPPTTPLVEDGTRKWGVGRCLGQGFGGRDSFLPEGTRPIETQRHRQ